MKDQLYYIQEGSVRYELGEIKNRMIHYDFGKVRIYLNAKGKLLFGKHFKIHPEDHGLLYKLCTYVISDREGCVKIGLDPDKGLLLSGPVGCGKTSLMKLIRHLASYKRTYKMAPSRNIVFTFNNTGFGTIEKYHSPDQYCFDDLGIEPKGRYFGQDCNVMGEIILSRYEIFSQSREKISGKVVQTHITTNLNAEELEDKYGMRVRSRMRGMLNLISFDESSKDKRQ